MDIFQEKKKQQYLVLLIIAMVIGTAGILLYSGYADKPPAGPDITETDKYKKPVINWHVLESAEMKELRMP